MRIKNESGKVIGIGDITLLPLDEVDVPETYRGNHILRTYENMGFISVHDAGMETGGADTEGIGARDEALARALLEAERYKKLAEEMKQESEDAKAVLQKLYKGKDMPEKGTKAAVRGSRNTTQKVQKAVKQAPALPEQNAIYPEREPMDRVQEGETEEISVSPSET